MVRAFYCVLSRDIIQDDIEKLREEKKNILEDIATANLRMYASREEKLKAVPVLENLKKVEDELERLMEERSLFELEEKVNHRT